MTTPAEEPSEGTVLEDAPNRNPDVANAAPSLRELVCLAPRETAGARSADRFDYQIDWALCKLLALHDSVDDYVVLFDYHDDVVVLNSSVNPDEIRFFQIKTRVGSNWTIPELVRRQDGTLSILGKLFYHRMTFGERAVELAFVSNAAFRVRVDGSQRSVIVEEVSCDQLGSPDRESVINGLREEHQLDNIPASTGLTLRNADVPVRGHATYATGVLGEFLDRIQPNGAFRLAASYRAIKDEVQRKNNYVASGNDFDELLRHKGITRTGFIRILGLIQNSASTADRWSALETQLAAGGVGHGRLNRLRSEYQRTFALLLDPANAMMRADRDAVKEMLRAVVVEENDNRATVLRKVTDEFLRRGGGQSVVGRDQIDALVLHVMDEV